MARTGKVRSFSPSLVLAGLVIWFVTATPVTAYTDCQECKAGCQSTYEDDRTACYEFTGELRIECLAEAAHNKEICLTNCETDFNDCAV